MANIKITPELLRQKSTELKGLKGEQEVVMGKITSLVNGLSEQWTGDAQQAFQSKYQSMEPQLRKFADVIENYTKLMDKAAMEMESTDQSIKGAIDSFS